MGDLERAAHAYYSVLEATPSDDDLHLQIGHLEKLPISKHSLIERDRLPSNNRRGEFLDDTSARRSRIP